MRFLVVVYLCYSTLLGYELGTVATASPNGMYYKLGSDISQLVSKYNIDLQVIQTEGSYQNMAILDGHFISDKNTFFAIVQKDVISYYNYIQYKNNNKTIYHTIPAVLSLGVEQIHIFTAEANEFDFENRKTFKVYCGGKESGSCVTARYIEKAYNFNFIYINSQFETVVDKIDSGMVDLIISVTQSPAKKFQDIQGLKLIDLPTNFVMEDMYTHATIKKEDYSFLSEDIHAFAVSKVLITNLSDRKYDPIIENLVKIIVLNKNLLIKEYGSYWEKIDFSYTNFKKMSPIAKETIESIYSKTKKY